jgi:RNA polymerase sigma-70 factor, ECF subfamily
LARRVQIAENELVGLLRSGSEKGFHILYDNYSAALYGVIGRMVENKELAEDLLQECFVKIWNNISMYDESKGRLFTWMINMARNLCIDKLRSKDYNNSLKNRDIDGTVHIYDQQQSSQHNPDHIGLRKIVGQLQPEQARIIELMYFKGYTQSEIAEEFSIPLGTVKTRARAALGKLRSLFAEPKMTER